MIDVAIWCLVIGIVCVIAFLARECPREILNDYCRGPYCDHSKEAVEAAHKERDRWS